VSSFVVRTMSLDSLLGAGVEVDSIQVRWLLTLAITLATMQVDLAASVNHILNRDNSSLVALQIRLLVLNSTC